MTLQRYRSGRDGLIKKTGGTWCRYDEALAEIERLRDALKDVWTTEHVKVPNKPNSRSFDIATKALGE